MGTPQFVMEEDLAGLSDEEREALKVEDSEVDLLKKVAGEDADQEAEDEQPEQQAAEGEQASPAGEEQGPAPDTGDEEDQPFVPRYTVQEPENYDARAQELSKKRAEVVASYKDGAIELDEMLKQLEEIDQQRTDLRLAKEKADLLREQNEQHAEQLWQWEINRFMRMVKRNEGIDYTDSILNAALDVAVKDLANKPENADKDGEWFLTEAHKLVKAKFGLDAKQAKDPQPKKDTVKQALEERKPDLKAVPRTLAETPRAGEESTGEDKFAYLDKLSGIEQEMALAKLTDEEVQQYLTGR